MEWRYSATLWSTYPSGQSPYLLDRSLCGPQGRFGHCEVATDLFALPRIELQPIARRYPISLHARNVRIYFSAINKLRTVSVGVMRAPSEV
jgi:hypothetical protein